jgi:hypothetical protein
MTPSSADMSAKGCLSASLHGRKISRSDSIGTGSLPGIVYIDDPTRGSASLAAAGWLITLPERKFVKRPVEEATNCITHAAPRFGA